ncbi:transcription initiation protein [Emticicia sp. CRIBPO]|uniref:YciI family protein n=1 Tax=Emticicia sp. CRIBPO TaxID=2683258 RepID=UPI0014130D85|nr:YciI family protein [Emticicia sp. CRIBPO]NBA84228.1 transcription initiation protein [Emticicia sp. CRIBPO]
MDEFLLIFRHQDGGKLVSPEQMQIWMQQTMDWLGGIAAQNKLVSNGMGLSFDDSRVVRPNNIVTNGPYTETKEAIGGFVVVRAESADEAAEMAKGSPVLQGPDNSIEVRKVARH